MLLETQWKKIHKIHNQAMDLAEMADLSSFKGEEHTARHYYEKAFLLEKEAAFLLPSDKNAEPIRSIYFRSAASLAAEIQDYEAVKKLVKQGLGSATPADIAHDMQLILTYISFRKTVNDWNIDFNRKERKHLFQALENPKVAQKNAKICKVFQSLMERTDDSRIHLNMLQLLLQQNIKPNKALVTLFEKKLAGQEILLSEQLFANGSMDTNLKNKVFKKLWTHIFAHINYHPLLHVATPLIIQHNEGLLFFVNQLMKAKDYEMAAKLLTLKNEAVNLVEK